MGRPGDRLAEYRAYLGMTLEEIEAHYGVKGSTWSYAETEGKGISSKILDALRRVPPPAGKSRPDFDWLGDGSGEMLPHVVEEQSAGYVTGVLPEHVQEAYKVVREALDIAKVDISTIDQDRIGLVIGLAAEEIARGNRAEARQTLLRRAEVLLGLKVP